VTCIAGVPGRLVADSRETGAIKRNCVKFFRKHEYIVGGAGASAPLAVLEHVLPWPKSLSVPGLTRWVYKHHDPDYIDFEETELIIVTAKAVFVTEGRIVHPPASFGAVGSGSAWALGYLEASPGDLDGAVKAACKYDPYCAGPLRGVEL
jgi:hypothetical protein